VLLMVGPRKRHEDIDVQQIYTHGKSLSASRTFFIVIPGAPLGGVNTAKPLTTSTGTEDSSPRRARSETAFPRETFKDAARFEAASKTSSSNVRVVLMKRMMHHDSYDVNLIAEASFLEMMTNRRWHFDCKPQWVSL